MRDSASRHMAHDLDCNKKTSVAGATTSRGDWMTNAARARDRDAASVRPCTLLLGDQAELFADGGVEVVHALLRATGRPFRQHGFVQHFLEQHAIFFGGLD